MSNEPTNVTRMLENSRMSGIQKRIIIICLALGIADGLNSLSVGYAIPSLSEKWGVGASQFSLVIVSAVVGEILASITLAPLADRFGRKTMVWIGIVTFGVSTLLAAFSPNVFFLAACRFISGIGIGTASPNLFALGSDYSPAKFKATAITIIGTGMALGGSICGIIACFVIPTFGGSAIFIVAGAIPLLVLLIVFAFLPDSLEVYVAQGKMKKIADILNQIESTTSYADRNIFVTDGTQRESRVSPSELFREGRALSTTMVWSMLLLSIVGSYFVFSWLTTLLTMSGVEQSTAIFGTSITTFGGIVGGILLGIAMDRT